MKVYYGENNFNLAGTYENIGSVYFFTGQFRISIGDVNEMP
jgi:hypothetical protein